MQNYPTIFTIENIKIRNNTEINRHTCKKISNLDIHTFCYTQFKDLILHSSKQQCPLFYRFVAHIEQILSPSLTLQHRNQEKKLAIHYLLLFCQYIKLIY